MNAEAGAMTPKRDVWLKGVRLLIYLGVLANTFFYVFLDFSNFQILLPETPLIQKVQTFAVTIDYMGWLMTMGVLYFLARWREVDQIGQRRTVLLGTLATLGAVALSLAFYLYVLGYFYYDDFERYASSQVCSLADVETYYLDDWQLYQSLTAENCEALSGGDVFRHKNDPVLISALNLNEGIWLALVEVFNALAWLVVVGFAQMGLLAERLWPRRVGWLRFLSVGQKLFYVVLFLNAAYWLLLGLWVDAWDAFLWLFGFWALQASAHRGHEKQDVNLPVA
ncbi:MAG: hypothetical protein CL917_04705 [Deltaproteobacteria bacterium]|nr:hypothetical protein [Deltaproteobacteria bacterium]